MPNLRPRTNLSAMINKITQRWRNWKGTNASLADFVCCGEYEVERMAHDLGMPVSALRSVTKHGPDAADLLVRRMMVLNLDWNEVATTAPSTFQDLQRLCTLCESRKQCARELTRDQADKAWEDYCPNVAVLKMLDALPWTTRREW